MYTNVFLFINEWNVWGLSYRHLLATVPSLPFHHLGAWKLRSEKNQTSDFTSCKKVFIWWYNRPNEHYFIKRDYTHTPPVHVADVFFHQASVEVDKESPGRLSPLSEAISSCFMDVRVCGILLKSIREAQRGLRQDCKWGSLETWESNRVRRFNGALGLRKQTEMFQHWWNVYGSMFEYSAVEKHTYQLRDK